MLINTLINESIGLKGLSYKEIKEFDHFLNMQL